MKLFKKIIYTLSVAAACYGFWGVCLPEAGFLRGTSEIISGGEDLGAAELYQMALRGEVRLEYGSRLWEWITKITEG
ncbi:MAG: hypothetical protein LUE16_00365 [Lachnospiraceae bacterium]|nr:hypothetical protein [Lachnospiraceae bacterium]